MVRLLVGPADIDLDEEGVVVEEVYLVEYFLYVTHLDQLTGSFKFFLNHSESNFVDSCCRVEHHPWGVDCHYRVSLFCLHLYNLHRGIPPIPDRENVEELSQKLIRIVEREELADLRHQNGP